MPRFFYDFFDGDAWSDDDVGLDLASAERAYLEAHHGARSLWLELIEARRNPFVCAFEVRDKDGQPLFRFDFGEVLESCHEPAVRRLPSTRIVREVRDTQRKVLAATAEIRSALADVYRSLEQSASLLQHARRLEQAKPDR